MRGAAALGALLLLVPLTGGAATIEGRVIHPTRPEVRGDLEVRLLGVRGSGETIRLRARTDAEGRFRFEDVPAPAAYAIAADYGDLSFSGGTMVFEEGQESDTRSSTFHVYDHASDPSPLEIQTLMWVVSREAGVYRIRQTARVFYAK